MDSRYSRLLWPMLIAGLVAVLFFKVGFFDNRVLASESSPPDYGLEAASTILINELMVKGRNEWVELHNTTAGAIALRGWYVTETECSQSITDTIGAVTLEAGGYWVLGESDPGFSEALDNDGAIIVLCDAEGTEVDRVAYGTQGGAPLAHTGDSIARVAGGVDTDDSARDWNVTITPTKGLVNDVASVSLGKSLVINEFEGGRNVGKSRIELYNPTPNAITITDWMYSDGDMSPAIVTTKSIAVQPGGFFTFTSEAHVSDVDVVYLFDAEGARVDQVGCQGLKDVFAPQRVPDGAGPNDGYTWASSGGDKVLLDLPHTWGRTNNRVLHITKTTPQGIVKPGDVTSLTITYGNLMPEMARNVVITEVLPEGVVYRDFLAYTQHLTLTQTNPPAWEVGTVASQTKALTFTLWVTLAGPFSEAPLQNVIWIASESEGFVPVSATVPIDIMLPPPDLTVSKSVRPTDAVALGDVVTYTLVLSNSGMGIAQNVLVTDPLTTCVAFGGWVTVEQDWGSATMPPPVVRWGPWDVPAKTEYTVAFTATVAAVSGCAERTITNTAYFASDNAGSGIIRASFTTKESARTVFLPLILRIAPDS